MYRFATGFLKEHGIPYYPGANAAYFLWIDLKRVTKRKEPTVNGTTMELKALELKSEEASTKDGETSEVTKNIMKRLLKNKVFLTSSIETGGEEEGWFRLVFSQDRRYLEEGLKRIVKTVSEE